MNGPAGSGAPAGTALRFGLFGTPIEVRPSIVVLLVLFGLDLGSPALVAVWVVVGLLSILVHELGHAVVARIARARPTVELAGLGGLTSYRPTPRLSSRRWRLAVSLAGPAVGLVVWGGLVLLSRAWRPTSELAVAAIDFGMFTSLVWSVFNLLPVIPLDGGQALAQVLPGDEVTRTRRAFVVGAVVAALGVLVALYFQLPFAAVFLGFLGWRNIRSHRDSDPTAVAERAQAAAQTAPVSVAQRITDGEADVDEVVRLLRRADAAGEHRFAADLAEHALAHDVHDHRIAWQAARSWVEVGDHPRARRMVEQALALGADGEQVWADPRLAPLR